jgi:hypothetical protein
VGGDDSGARILAQFDKYFMEEQSEMLCVINASRPDTSTIDGALRHIMRIERETSLKVSGIVNNTHMIHETTAEDILKGYELARNVSRALGISVKYNCCVEGLVKELTDKTGDMADFKIFPIKLFMRENWMNR